MPLSMVTTPTQSLPMALPNPPMPLPCPFTMKPTILYITQSPIMPHTTPSLTIQSTTHP